MTNIAPVVSSVTSQDYTVTIEFEDGHRAVFEGYSHGFGYNIEGLRRFFLFHEQAQVVRYDSRLHRAGPQEDEHRFVRVTEGYTRERIVGYWEAARDYLHEEYFLKPLDEDREGPGELWVPWRVVSEGWMDLARIKEGHVPLPDAVS